MITIMGVQISRLHAAVVGEDGGSEPRRIGLDLLHVHYAVPHATAAILARSMLPESRQPRVVTTLHGTDTTLLGRDAGYGPAIRHALSLFGRNHDGVRLFAAGDATTAECRSAD